MYNFNLTKITILKISALILFFFFGMTNAVKSQVIQWSTYLNTTGTDNLSGMLKDNAGDIYILGSTNANGYPVTAGAFQTTLTGTTTKLIISKLSGDNGSLIWSTYLGGDNDNITALKFYWDAVSNTINVAAITISNNYPVVNGNPRLPGSNHSSVFSQLNAATGTVLFSTFVFTELPLDVYGGGPLDVKIEIADGFAYYLSMDPSYKKILISKINLVTHQFAYQNSIPGGNGIFNHAIGMYSILFRIDTGEIFLSGATSSSNYSTTAGSYQPFYPAGANEAF